MSQYQVPQFLEVEDRIFGPLTFKQFLYTAGGLGLGFILWTILPSTIALIVGTPVVIFFMALAFFKVNDRPFIFLVESAIKYAFSKKLYIWKKTPKKPEKKEVEREVNTQISVPRLTESKLRDLSWELDIHETLEAPNEGVPENNNNKNWRNSLKF